MNDALSARQIAVETLQELGDGQEPVSESWLVKDGYVIGRRFQSSAASAVWLFDYDQVKVYTGDRKLLKVVNITSARKAA